uniref:Uncharacterized protein n=1 Tax=Arundo donax TaxID=35708 RepID=A0A0A9E5H1_ARUDO
MKVTDCKFLVHLILKTGVRFSHALIISYAIWFCVQGYRLLNWQLSIVS